MKSLWKPPIQNFRGFKARGNIHRLSEKPAWYYSFRWYCKPHKGAKQATANVDDQIAEETKKTVLEAFNTELSDQLNNAKTTLEIWTLSPKTQRIGNDNTDIEIAKKNPWTKPKKAHCKSKKRNRPIVGSLFFYLDKKINLNTDYSNDLALLENAVRKPRPTPNVQQ
jgi:hypothetical protein